MTTKTDLERIAAKIAADLPSLAEHVIARMDSDPGCAVQERTTLLYGREDEQIDAVAWIRHDCARRTLVVWAGNYDDPNMDWPVEVDADNE